MKVEFTSHDFRDFAQRYQETFGWLEREDKPDILVKLQSVGQDRTIFIDEKGFSYTALSDKGNFFSFLPVSKGSYLYNNSIVVVQRIPARQWKRGICTSNTSIRGLGGEYYDVDFPVLKSIFSDTYNDTINRFRETLDGSLVLLNKQFSIFKDYLYLYNTRIGEYSSGKIKMSNEMFSQELLDIMVQESLPVEIV